MVPSALGALRVELMGELKTVAEFQIKCDIKPDVGIFWHKFGEESRHTLGMFTESSSSEHESPRGAIATDWRTDLVINLLVYKVEN